MPQSVANSDVVIEKALFLVEYKSRLVELYVLGAVVGVAASAPCTVRAGLSLSNARLLALIVSTIKVPELFKNELILPAWFSSKSQCKEHDKTSYFLISSSVTVCMSTSQ